MVVVKDIEVVLLDMFEYIKRNLQTSIDGLNTEKGDKAINDLVLGDRDILEYVNIEAINVPTAIETTVDNGKTIVIQSPNEKIGQATYGKFDFKYIHTIEYTLDVATNLIGASVDFKSNGSVIHTYQLSITPGDFSIDVSGITGIFDLVINLDYNTTGDKFYELSKFEALDEQPENIYLWTADQVPNYPVAYLLEVPDTRLNVKSLDGYKFKAEYPIKLTSFIYFNAEVLHRNVAETYTILINRYSRLFFNFFRDFLSERYKLEFKSISTGVGEDNSGREVVIADITFSIDIVL